MTTKRRIALPAMETNVRRPVHHRCKPARIDGIWRLLLTGPQAWQTIAYAKKRRQPSSAFSKRALSGGYHAKLPKGLTRYRPPEGLATINTCVCQELATATVVASLPSHTRLIFTPPIAGESFVS